VLRSLGIKVSTRLGPETGDIIGYSLAAPGDTGRNGEPIWYGGSKLAPDLSINRLRERLTTQDTAERPQHTADPTGAFRHTATALRAAQSALDTGPDATAQGYLAAFGDTLHTLALTTHGPHQSELRAAATAFNRARRSTIRADHHAATALHQAGRELLHASHEPGGLAVSLIFAALQLARAAAHWHARRGHQQQAAAAEQAFRHLQTGYEQTARPVLAELTRRVPHPHTVQRFETAIRHTLPSHADRILTDPAWPALATTLARAETAGHNTSQLLAEAAAHRELNTAEHPAQVLIWRLTTQPNRRTQAARARSTMNATTHTPAPQPAPTVAPEPRAQGKRTHQP
jgi:hypothetical protein